MRAAGRVSIVTEFDGTTMERYDYVGEDILRMSDKDAGIWAKLRVRRAISAAETEGYFENTTGSQNDLK